MTHMLKFVFVPAVAGVLLFALTACGSASDRSSASTPAAASSSAMPASSSAMPASSNAMPASPSAEPSESVKATPLAPKMTNSQEQAVKSAETYLAMTAFSRSGLIRQLSSAAGEGFPKADATYAVDHITVNWNEEAAKSAKAYLDMSAFSRAGLIQQLESSAGEGYTHAEAVYGVTKAGL